MTNASFCNKPTQNPINWNNWTPPELLVALTSLLVFYCFVEEEISITAGILHFIYVMSVFVLNGVKVNRGTILLFLPLCSPLGPSLTTNAMIWLLQFLLDCFIPTQGRREENRELSATFW